MCASTATSNNRKGATVQPDCCVSFCFLLNLKEPPGGGLQGWCWQSPGSVPRFQHYQLPKAVQPLRNHSKSLCGLCVCSYELHNSQLHHLTSRAALGWVLKDFTASLSLPSWQFHSPHSTHLFHNDPSGSATDEKGLGEKPVLFRMELSEHCLPASNEEKKLSVRKDISW